MSECVSSLFLFLSFSPLSLFLSKFFPSNRFSFMLLILPLSHFFSLFLYLFLSFSQELKIYVHDVDILLAQMYFLDHVSSERERKREERKEKNQRVKERRRKRKKSIILSSSFVNNQRSSRKFFLFDKGLISGKNDVLRTYFSEKKERP